MVTLNNGDFFALRDLNFPFTFMSVPYGGRNPWGWFPKVLKFDFRQLPGVLVFCKLIDE